MNVSPPNNISDEIPQRRPRCFAIIEMPKMACPTNPCRLQEPSLDYTIGTYTFNGYHETTDQRTLHISAKKVQILKLVLHTNMKLMPQYNHNSIPCGFERS